MSREKLIASTNASSLSWQETEEKAIDRVTAIGMASKSNRLGAELLHAEALDAQSLKRAILIIARLVNRAHKISLPIAQRVATAAIREQMSSRCGACNGVPFLTGRVSKMCPVCKGSGLKRYSNGDRFKMMGIKIKPDVYELALALARDNISNVVRDSDKLLAK